jgi:hypothetical protein
METSQGKSLPDLRWVPLEGTWEKDGEDALVYVGGEYAPPVSPATSPATVEESKEPRPKLVWFGTALFDQHFKDGRIRMQVEFSKVDHRSIAAIMIQYDPGTKDMLVFGVSGGGLKFEPGVSGYFFKLMRWASPRDQTQSQQGGSAPPKVWTPLFEVGLGVNLRADRPYDLEVLVRGAVVTLYVDGVEIGKHTLAIPSLPGNPWGIFCGSHSKVHFRKISFNQAVPKAFVVMQFEPPEYEALFQDVIEPVCRSEGLKAYRADSTYLPGLVIEDIKRQIAESRVVIAEITPSNPNVYYEVGYADALNKPLILIADREEGLKPFDVRAYRTIFYENSIGGKNRIENDLRAYLKGIMDR